MIIVSLSSNISIYSLIQPTLLFQNYAEREKGKVVVYITTLGVLRETYARCVTVRQILRTLMIKVDERDVFMARDNQMELMDRMGFQSTEEIVVPQVFVEGRHLGVSFGISEFS